MLPRTIRPWMCIWYICHSQKRLLESTDISGRILAVKSRRSALEELFVQLTAPP
jgi:hypothetical protein